jgi:hypothetical protein
MIHISVASLLDSNIWLPSNALHSQSTPCSYRILMSKSSIEMLISNSKSLLSKQNVFHLPISNCSTDINKEKQVPLSLSHYNRLYSASYTKYKSSDVSTVPQHRARASRLYIYSLLEELICRMFQ